MNFFIFVVVVLCESRNRCETRGMERRELFVVGGGGGGSNIARYFYFFYFYESIKKKLYDNDIFILLSNKRFRVRSSSTQ